MRWLAVVAICIAVTTAARADDWGVRRDPFDPGVVRRYKALLARDPHDAAALRSLISLYQRYRTVERLESEYRAQLASGEDWATLVVLARMPRPARADTVALWERALKVKPDDTHGWLARGDLASGAADARTAQDAYRRAATLAAKPRDKKRALMKLIGAAHSTGDHAAIDAAYGELIALAPKDGALWLDRGNAQLTAGHAAAARTSFATAQGLLATDPERRLTAMMNEGIALERRGNVDEALAQYERTLDKLPRGYHLGAEIVSRIVAAERTRGRLAAAITRLETRWPERRRGPFEWNLLGDLYAEQHDDEAALAAYKRAVAKAPTEVTTQRKLIALLDKLRPDEALAQHETAARLAPGDADLQLALAKRYRATAPAKALMTLERLARRLKSNINVRRAIAGLYDEWNEPMRAIGEYEAIVRIEPHDPDHAIALGEMYWRIENRDKAREAWARLTEIGTADALFRHGEVLAIHELWHDAVTAYTRALAVDGTNANAWYGRARAHEEISYLPAAVADARRAVALTASATHADGRRYRHLLVRILGRGYSDGDRQPLTTSLAKWRFAFEHGDTLAGYLLAEHHGRIGSDQQHEVLLGLYREVPTDDALGIALARSFVRRKEFTRARQQLELVAKRTPARAEEIATLVEHVEQDRKRYELEARMNEEGLSRRARQQGADAVDLVGRHRRFGMRLELGADVRTTSSALLGFGLYRSHRLARGTALAIRADWTQRDDQMEEVNAIGLGGIVTRRLVDTRKLEIAAGIGPRVELRYGSDATPSSWGRAAIAGDITLELLPRALPATLGLRYHHSLTDAVGSSALVFELGFELR